MRLGKITPCVFTILFLSACNSTPQMQITKPTAFEVPPPIEFDEVRSTFALAKLINDLDRGQQIFAFPGRATTDGILCNATLGRIGVVTATGGKQYLGDWSSELGELFYDELTKMGYAVAGDPEDLFTQATSIGSAEFLVGGRLTDMSGNFCMEHDQWYGWPLQTVSGEMAVTFEWSILNTLTKEVSLKETTSGYYRMQKPEVNGILVVFEQAFLDAVRRLGSLDKVRKIARGERLTSEDILSPGLESISITNGKKRDRFQVDQLRQFVVTLRVGLGHGSGFLIGKEGHVLTNAHVVGDAKSVQVLTANGLELQGNVIAKNKARDVALVKIPSRVSEPIRIEKTAPEVSSIVYAMGTPLNEGLKATVTKGVLSAERKDKVSGLTFLQSDVAISPGSSGGPLLDENGQVIGISVAKFVGQGAEGLGLFIPIDEALQSLGVQVE